MPAHYAQKRIAVRAGTEACPYESLIVQSNAQKEKTSLRFWREAFVHLENPSYGVINTIPTLARNLSRLGLQGCLGIR